MRARLVLLISASICACGIEQRGESDRANGGAGGNGIDGGSAGWVGSGGGFPKGGAAGAVSNGGSGGSVDAGAGGATPDASSGGNGATGGASSGTIDYVASVADCVGAASPNPDVCATEYNELHVDVSADLLGEQTSIVYLRFDLDNQTAGASSITAQLVLTNVNSSDKSGEVHEVAPFKRPDLYNQAPSLGQLVGADLGPVITGQVVTWSLTSSPGPNKPFCLAISTTSTDGIGYSRLGTSFPPKLRVTYSK